MQSSLPKTEFWRGKARTAKGLSLLLFAQLLVIFVPFGRWRATLGHSGRAADVPADLEEARRLAADVEWAARKYPLAIKCLPQAMALSWMLRGREIAHAVVISVRPSELRQSPDALHAWVEVNRKKILGDLPGPWIETLRLGV